MRWVEFLNRLLRKPPQPVETPLVREVGLDSNLPPEVFVEKIVKYLQTIDENEHYTCSQVYQLLDQYAESSLRGEDLSRLMPLVKSHLDKCIGCNELYETLLNILESV